MKTFLYRLLFILALLVVPAAVVNAQSKASTVQKKADKKKEANIEKQKKGELKGRKRHMALQTKDVRKRMKKHSRYVKNQQLNKKRGFFYRLLHRNEH